MYDETSLGNYVGSSFYIIQQSDLAGGVGPYLGISGVARKIKKIYIGIDEVAKQVDAGYLGNDNDKASLFFQDSSWLGHTGETWSLSNVSNYCDLCYSANGFVFAANGNISQSNTYLYYSTDGKNFSAVEEFTAYFYDICYSPVYNIITKKWSSSIYVATTYAGGLWYSTDGKTWSYGGLGGGESGSIGSIYYNGKQKSGKMWVANVAANGLAYSSTGKSWTAIGAPISSCVRYAIDTWVAVGPNGIYRSYNGTIWAEVDSVSGIFYSVCHGNGVWVAGGENGLLYYSSNGTTWTECTTITTSSPGDFKHICYKGGIWIAGSSKGGLFYSSNGRYWYQSNVTSGGFKSIDYNNDIWFATCNGDGDGDCGLYRSVNGKTWSKVTSFIGVPLCVTHNDERWIIGCEKRDLLLDVIIYNIEVGFRYRVMWRAEI